MLMILFFISNLKHHKNEYRLGVDKMRTRTVDRLKCGPKKVDSLLNIKKKLCNETREES